MEFKGYSQLWGAIIRPPRDSYQVEDLGPNNFTVKGFKQKRTDIQLQNPRGLKLECSLFEPQIRVAPQLPCVIYLHGNCSSRIEALSTVRVLLSQNIQLFCFDFGGCGLSEGEYISLGHYEKEDLSTVVDYLRESGKVSTIGLWGRSMGAVTALLHGHRDPSIAGMVLDSPFSDLKDLAFELARKHTKIPGFVLSGAMKLVRSTIKKKANFDIYDLTPIKHVENCFIPALFGVGMQDDFIEPHHAQKIHEKYAGDKNMISFEGDHNSERPKFFFDSAAIFFFNTLQVDQLPQTNSNKTDLHPATEFMQAQGAAVHGQPFNGGPQLDLALQNLGDMGIPQDILLGSGEAVHNEEDDEDLRAAIAASLAFQKDEESKSNQQHPAANGDLQSN